MKFLLKFITCCTPCRSFKTSSLSLGADDTRSLVSTVPPSIPSKNFHYRNSKRWRTAASKSGSASYWRPSHNAISEDNVVVLVVKRGNRAATAGSERILKRKVSPTPRSHIRNRQSNDYAPAPIQAIMSAFSPTPFMF